MFFKYILFLACFFKTLFDTMFLSEMKRKGGYCRIQKKFGHLDLLFRQIAKIGRKVEIKQLLFY